MEKVSLEEKNLMRRYIGKSDLIQLVPDNLKRADKLNAEQIRRRNKLRNKMKTHLNKEMKRLGNKDTMQIGARKTKKRDQSIEGLRPTDKHHINNKPQNKPQKPNSNNSSLKPTIKRNIEMEGNEE